jgi:hypothetical protein
MPCTVDISPSDESNHYQVLLCKAFKYLTPEQIATVINPGSGIADGLDWYSGHLAFDYSRRCHNHDVLNFDFETNQQEKLEILRELNRIGYDLKVTEHWTELVNFP